MLESKILSSFPQTTRKTDAQESIILTTFLQTTILHMTPEATVLSMIQQISMLTSLYNTEETTPEKTVLESMQKEIDIIIYLL